MKVFLDIETLPPERDPFRETPASADEREYRDLALSGDWGRILTIGLIIEMDGRETHRGILGRERQTMRFHLDEARTLRAFWRLLRDFNSRRDLVIGHNVFDFDLPFIYKRSVVHRVRPAVELSFACHRSCTGRSDGIHIWRISRGSTATMGCVHLGESLFFSFLPY